MTARTTIRSRVAAILAACSLCAPCATRSYAKNPIIHADVPDVSMMRVGDTYYMSSTTMHMSPGLPIMKSKDLVNWEMLNYAYDRLGENDELNLENGRNAYGRGSWASSIRYHDGVYYVSTFSSHDRQDLHLPHPGHRERAVGDDFVRAVAARLVAVLRRRR